MKYLLFILLIFYLIKTNTCLYENIDEIEIIENNEKLDSLLKSNKTYVVQFYATWCRVSRGFSSDFIEIARILKNDVTFIAIKNEDISNKYKVNEFPSIQMFFTKDNVNKLHIDVFKGELTKKNVVSFIFESLKNFRLKELNIDINTDKKSSYKKNTEKNSGKVIILTDKNFDKEVFKNDDQFWFIFFYAPWCGHSKPIHPIFDKLAKKVADMVNVKIAKVDATVEKYLAQNFAISHFPTFRYYNQGKKTYYNSEEYKEGRGLSDFYDFILKHYKEKKELIQLTSQEQFNELCEKGVCLLAILPSLEDVDMKTFKSYIDILNNVLNNVSNLPVTILWFIAGEQLNIIQKLNLFFGFPAVIALSLSKNVYSVLKGNYSEQSIKQFIIQMMTGKISVDNLVSFTINKTKQFKFDEKEKVSKSDEL